MVPKEEEKKKSFMVSSRSRPHYSETKKTKSSMVRQGLKEHVCKSSGFVPGKGRGHLDLCAGDVQILVSPRNCLQ